MNKDSILSELGLAPDPSETSPVLIIPYMWIGDFVRGHTVVRVLKERWPNRPVDLLTTSLCAPLVDYMPGVRRGIVWDLPRGRLALAKQWALAKQFQEAHYGTALVMPRTWKSAIAPALAAIPQRTGFVGEVRFGLINDWRWGERALPASSTKTQPSRFRQMYRCRKRNGLYRSLWFQPRKSPRGEVPTDWATAPPSPLPLARSAPQSAGLIMRMPHGCSRNAG